MLLYACFTALLLIHSSSANLEKSWRSESERSTASVALEQSVIVVSSEYSAPLRKCSGSCALYIMIRTPHIEASGPQFSSKHRRTPELLMAKRRGLRRGTQLAVSSSVARFNLIISIFLSNWHNSEERRNLALSVSCLRLTSCGMRA